MGTPLFAKIVLERLLKDYSVVCIVSQPDKEKTRKNKLLMTKTKEVAIIHNIDILQPHFIKDSVDEIISYQPDLIITCAYGQFIPKKLLEYPRYGCINVHGSLLPKYRGGAPIHHAIINGEEKTGITIMYMSLAMDAGDIINQEEIRIEESDNLDSLYNKLAILGGELLVKTIPLIVANKVNRIIQNENEVTYGYNITKEEEKINFNNKMINVYNQVRGLNSNPGAYTIFAGKIMKVYNTVMVKEASDKNIGEIVRIDKDGIVVKVLDGLIKITDLKIEGKKRMSARDYLNSVHNKEELVGVMLGK